MLEYEDGFVTYNKEELMNNIESFSKIYCKYNDTDIITEAEFIGRFDKGDEIEVIVGNRHWSMTVKNKNSRNKRQGWIKSKSF